MNNYSSKNSSEQKYLKYKKKYLKFKQTGGKIHDSSNYYIYFCFNKEKTKVFIDALEDYSTLSIEEIDRDLTLSAIKYNFENEFSIVVASKSKIKDGIISIDKIYIKEKIDIIKLMSKINLLTLIKSLEDKFNSYQKNIQPNSSDVDVPDISSILPIPASASTTPAPVSTTPAPASTAPASTAPASTAPASTAPAATKPTPTPIKTGGAPIGNIKISTVLLFEKDKDNMNMISHFKVEDDNIEDVSIMEKFNISYTENKESPKIEKKRSSFFGRNR
jgi:hypothetical protein